MKKIILLLSAILLAAFGFLTLFLSSSLIFDLFDIRAKEGNYVSFVVWANFVSSWLYLIAAYGFFRIKKWTVRILVISGVILFIAFTGLIIHINLDGLYETKTIGAMIFRISVTFVFAMIGYFFIMKNQKHTA